MYVSIARLDLERRITSPRARWLPPASSARRPSTSCSGWTVNHAHTFHGTPMRDLPLEQGAAAGPIRRLSPTRERRLIDLDRATRGAVPEMPEPSGNPMERTY